MSNGSVTIHAVGDIALGDHPLCAGFGTHSQCRDHAPEYAFEHVRGELAGADILFGNMECTLSENGRRAGDYHSVQMRGHPGYLDGLRATGFHVLNVANNHSLQHGQAPFNATIEMLKGAGIRVCGLAASNYRTCVPEIIEKNGLRIGFLGYSLRPRQYFTAEPLYAEGYREEILADVRALRARCDSLVVSLHWGDEFIDRASPEEMALAHEIMDTGADLIIGHHPHVLRGVEKYGRGYIVYSLGNFVCDMLWDEPLRETLVVKCRLTAEGVKDLSLTPVRINDSSQPVPLSGAAAQALLARVGVLSDALHAAASNPAERETQAAYQVAAHTAHAHARKLSHRYFLRKAYRFPPGMVVQQIATFVRNRLAERGFIRKPESTMPGC